MKDKLLTILTYGFVLCMWGAIIYFAFGSCISHTIKDCQHSYNSSINHINIFYNKIVSGDIKSLCYLFVFVLCIIVSSMLIRIRLIKRRYKTTIERIERELRAKDYQCNREIQAIKENCNKIIKDSEIQQKLTEWKTQKGYEQKKAEMQWEYKRKEVKFQEEYERKIEEIQKECEDNTALARRQNSKLLLLLKSKTPFKDAAQIVADSEIAIFEKEEEYMRHKSNPAYRAADKVRELRMKLKESLYESKQILYKYEFLLSLFPELRLYIDDDETLIHLSEYSSLDDFNDERDKVIDWIGEEAYNSLSVNERNQLALDRYKEREKSNWEIGIDYELYIGYLLREGIAPFDKKFRVIQFGEAMGLQDLGRDIIAEKEDSDGSKTIYIIQCKRWSENKVIHENVICQLFGTTVEYKIKNKDKGDCKVVPMFITTTEMSPTAIEFANRLGVVVLKIPIGDYPMIKCNINNGEKIYHLPFDQQYHRTRIDNEGEFYAMTVEEATRKGFRRAMKHFVN